MFDLGSTIIIRSNSKSHNALIAFVYAFPISLPLSISLSIYNQSYLPVYLISLTSNNSLRFCELQNQKYQKCLKTWNVEKTVQCWLKWSNFIWIFYANTLVCRYNNRSCPLCAANALFQLLVIVVPSIGHHTYRAL